MRELPKAEAEQKLLEKERKKSAFVPKAASHPLLENDTGAEPGPPMECGGKESQTDLPFSDENAPGEPWSNGILAG